MRKSPLGMLIVATTLLWACTNHRSETPSTTATTAQQQTLGLPEPKVMIARLKAPSVASMAQMKERLAPPTLCYELSPGKDTMIKGTEGTRVYIPDSALAFADGSRPTGPIKFEIKECYSYGSMIAEGLSTVCGGQILQTGGMIYMKATADGKELMVQNGKSVVVSFPKKGAAEKMDLYYPDGRGGWELATKSNPNTGRAITVTKKDTVTTELPNLSFDLVQRLPPGFNNFKKDKDIFVDNHTKKLDKDYDLDSIKLVGTNMNICQYIQSLDQCTDTLLDNVYDRRAEFDVTFNISFSGRFINASVVPRRKDYMGDFEDEGYRFAAYLKKRMPKFDIKRYNAEHHLKARSNYDTIFTKVNRMTVYIGEYQRPYYFTCGSCFGTRLSTREIASFDTKNWDKAVDKMSAEGADYFLMSTAKLGWINCDHPWATGAENITYSVSVPDPKNTVAYLVFDDIKGIISGTYNGVNLEFRNVPMGRVVKIIAISHLDTKPVMATMHTNVSRDVPRMEGFSEFTLARLEHEVNGGEPGPL